MGIPNLLFYAMPVFAVAMLFEYWRSLKLHVKVYDKSDLRANLGIALGDVLLGGLASMYGVAIFSFVNVQLMDYRLDILGYESLGWNWYVWILAILMDDLTFYWFHRSSHRVRLFWACHVVHHSSTYFNYSTAIRNGWFSIVYKPIFWIWMAVVGFQPMMIITCLSINAVYQFFCHTSLTKYKGWLSAFLCTSELHAIHHGKNPDYIDKNFAGIFIFYDRLFGTYCPITEGEKVIFGITDPPRSTDIFEITFHEFRSIIGEVKRKSSWSEVFAILFKPPGWIRIKKNR